MTMPPTTSVGEQLSSSWLNRLREEVKSNVIVSAKGLAFNRGTGGTTISKDVAVGSPVFTGELVTVINLTGQDLNQWWFVGIENVTNREKMAENISSGVDYIIRKPVGTDLQNRLLLLAEPIAYNDTGQAYISSSSMICRVKYATDGSEDNYQAATIADFDASEDEEDSYILKASPAGFISIVDVEPDTSQHPDEPDWRWAIIRFPVSLDQCRWKATSDPDADNKITAKRVLLDDTLDDDSEAIFDVGQE